MWTALALVLAIAAAGCGPTTRCFASKSDEAYDRCVDNEEAIDRAEREHEREERRLRAEARAAVGPCADGDPLACLTVATYGAGHDGDPAEIMAAYRSACDASLAAACVGGGTYAATRGDTATALAMHRRGCELRDARGCVGAAPLDPAHSMELETTACELGDDPACFRVGQGHLAAHRRDEAERFLTIACRHGEDEACQLLGRMDIEEAP